MKFRITAFVRPSVLVFSLLNLSVRSFGADLMPLNEGRNVHLYVVGHGPLCDAKVTERSPDVVTVRLLQTTSECGRKGQSIRLSKDKVADITPEERLTKGRVAAKILLGLGGVAALCAVPLTSSDPESWLIVGNGALPAVVVFSAWRAVPRRRDYAVALTCPDIHRCFADAIRPAP